MSTYVEIKPSDRIEMEERTSLTTCTSPPCSSLQIECPQEDDESSTYYKPYLMKGIKLPAQCASKQFLAQAERARRRCLTQMPSNLVRDSLLPPHLTKMLAPDRQDSHFHERRPTPTKEMILELLANSPSGISGQSLFSEHISKPALTKFNQLPNLVTNETRTSKLPNQLAELIESHPSSNHSGPSNSTCKPSKRRVRATYGVRLESIRLDADTDSARKCHSYDEYHPSHRDGLRLAPLVHAGKL